MDEIIKHLSNQELKDVYNELVVWCDIGDLKQDGVIKKVYKEICEKCNFKRGDFYIGTLKEMLLFEIARRTINYL